MAYYPPPGSHQSFVYPSTPLAPSNYLSPQPNVVYVPSPSSSRNSHRHDDREHRHGRSHSDSHGHGHSSSRKHSHRRHESDGHKHRRSSSRRHRDHSPQVVVVQQPQGLPVAQPNGYYPDGYQYYRPTWTQRLRQFFGLAPNPRDYNYNHRPNTHHSSGFFGRTLRKQRYYDPRTNAEVDRYGRPVYRR